MPDPSRSHTVAHPTHDEEEARLLIAERFPPEDGFVVEAIARSGY